MKSKKTKTVIFKLPIEEREWLVTEAARMSKQLGVRYTLSNIMRAALSSWRKQQARRVAHWRANGNR